MEVLEATSKSLADWQKLERDGSSGDVVIDGIRSIPEVEVLKKAGHVKLLAIHASQETRFKHLVDRGRSDAPSSTGRYTRMRARLTGLSRSARILPRMK